MVAHEKNHVNSDDSNMIKRQDGLLSQPKRRKKKSTQDAIDDKLGEALLQAAQAAGKHYGDAGLVSYLEAQAVATPSPFLSLLGRLLAREEKQQSHKITRIEIVAPNVDKENESTEISGLS